ncbi:MAG: Cna B-type domain-containing protein [Coriobacteriales bacterium]|jgi:hypothetical protein
MGTTRSSKRSGRTITRRLGAVIAVLAAALLLTAFAGMAVAETSADDGAAQAAEKVSINVKAKWVDDDDADGIRPASVNVQLMADGKIAKDDKDKPVIITLSAAKEWKGTVKAPAKKDGKAIKYTVAPKAIDKYKSAVKGPEAGKDAQSFEVTFTHEASDAAEDKAAPVPAADEKAADEGKDDKAADDKADAADDKAAGDKAGEDKADAADDKAADDKADDASDDKDDAADDSASDGKDAAKPAAADDDAKADEGDSDAKPGVAPMADDDPISVTKVWEDNDDAAKARPDSVALSLVVNDEVKETIELTAANGWKGGFTYTPDTQDTKFDVQEKAVEGYTPEVSGDVNEGFTVTNTYTAPEPEMIEISVTKAWSDSNDADGLRPDAVTVHLLANGEDTEQAVVLSADESWKGAFEPVAKEIDGAAVEYTVEEETVDGYTSEVSGDAEGGFTITNTHKVEKKDDGKKDDGKKDSDNKDKASKNDTKKVTPTCTVTATKVWKDNNNAKKTRTNVTLHLQKKVNGEWTTITGQDKAIAANAAGDALKVSWTGLPAEDANGKAIEYRVTEAWTKNYTSKITGDVKSGFTVTNTLGGVPKTGDSSGAGAATAVVLVIAAAGVLVATRRSRTRE